jgi:hypothetical protein
MKEKERERERERERRMRKQQVVLTVSTQRGSLQCKPSQNPCAYQFFICVNTFLKDTSPTF